MTSPVRRSPLRREASILQRLTYPDEARSQDAAGLYPIVHLFSGLSGRERLVAKGCCSGSLIMGARRRLSGLSAFPRPEHHESTVLGGAITLCSALLAVLLLVSELLDFVSLRRTTELGVDGERGQLDVPVSLDMTFPFVPCVVLTLDAGDVAGTQEEALLQQRVELSRSRLDAHGRSLGIYSPAQGLATGAMGQPQVVLLGSLLQLLTNVDTGELQQALRDREGCRLRASFSLPRVAGEFHVSTHTLAEQFLGRGQLRLNTSYVVHRLSFGPSVPGFLNALDGAERSAGDAELGGAFKHFIKLVPTTVKRRGRVVAQTHQYSCGEYFTRSKSLLEAMMAPAVSIAYDFSPVRITVNESRGPFLQLLVRASAIVGGVFSLGDATDRFSHRLLRRR